MLTCLLLCIGGNLWAQEVFVKVTSLDELKNNDEVIFVDKSEQYAMSKQESTYRSRTSVTINKNTCIVDANSEIQVLTLRKNSSTFGFYTGQGYLYKSSSASSNDLITSNPSSSTPTGNQRWVLSIDEDYLFSIKNYNSSSFFLQYNRSSPRFSSYSGRQENIYIFKKASSSKLTRDTNNTLGTICLSQNAIINCTAYSVAGKVSGEEKVILKEEGNVLEAGVPYIFYSANKHLEAIQYGTPVESPKTKNNGLIGTFTSVTIPKNTTNYCILTQNKLAHCGTGCKVGANRAYFDLSQMTEYTPSGAKPRFILTQDGVVDAIEALPSSSDSPAIYSITGTKTTQLTKGINIVKHADGTVTKVLKR